MSQDYKVQGRKQRPEAWPGSPSFSGYCKEAALSFWVEVRTYRTQLRALPPGKTAVCVGHLRREADELKGWLCFLEAI